MILIIEKNRIEEEKPSQRKLDDNFTRFYVVPTKKTHSIKQPLQRSKNNQRNLCETNFKSCFIKFAIN